LEEALTAICDFQQHGCAKISTSNRGTPVNLRFSATQLFAKISTLLCACHMDVRFLAPGICEKQHIRSPSPGQSAIFSNMAICEKQQISAKNSRFTRRCEEQP